MPPSPPPPGSSPTAGATSTMAVTSRLLTAYRHHDFPDLSSRRFPPDTLQSFSLPLEQNSSPTSPVPLSVFVAVVARVLGAYCASQDVLLALADGDQEKVLPVRVTWTDNHTWNDVAAGIAEALATPHWPRLHPDSLRRALDLSQRQTPALALISAGVVPHPNLGAHFPISVALNDDTILSATASERSCHPSQCKLFLSQVAALVQHALTQPKSLAAALPPLSQDLVSSYDKQPFEERRETYYLVPPVKYATEYVSIRATEKPNGVAVRWYADLSTDVPISTFTPEVITNEQLDKRANQLGRWLIHIGLQKGRSVAVCMKRDVLFHIVFIGILRAGGCYVPIDAELPSERQQYIARDSDAQFILSTSDMPCFPSLGDLAIDVQDPHAQQIIEQQSAEPLLVPELDDLSYILYTSGTTGTPKGCILTHRGLAEAIWALSQFCASAELAPPGRVNYLSIASVAFDVHIAEIMVALAVGIPILAAPRSLLLEDLPYYIKHLRVSHVGIVPSLIEATMGAVQADADSGAATTLRYIASGGEKMSDAILDKWADHPKVRLANFYGPSEVTIGCAARMMDTDTPRANIGHTFANVAAYVVDENMNIVLRGGTGELVVEGPLVGRGYVGRPDLAQKVFLKFPDDGTDRWAYRTGDLVRMMPDATLEIIGRIDTQIKLRGVRIESEGISSFLRNAAAPAHTLDVMTILAKHPGIGIDQLVSFVAWDPLVPASTRKGGIQPSASERELASYMRPSHIIPLEFIPLSSNGKADAKVLAAFLLALDMGVLTSLMTGAKSSAASDDVRREPTETERKVLGALEPYIKIPVERLSPHTNLFECGMDSLAVARFAADLRRAFDAKVTPAQIMQAPIVSGVAALIDGGATSVSDHPSSGVDRFADALREEVEESHSLDSVQDILPPLPVQEGVLYRSANAPTMYVQHVLMRLSPDITASSVREAWQQIVAQHEMLRTVFHFGSELAQVILQPGSYLLHIPEKEISECSDVEFTRYFTETEAASIARELNGDVSKVPPVRLSFFKHITSSTIYIVLSIHHALYDGISLPVLLHHLERICTHQSSIPTANLRDVLAHLATVDQGSAQRFWASYLDGFVWQSLLNKTATSSTAAVSSHAFARPLAELQAKAAENHVTLQALLMCAYGSLLAQHLYGHDDVVFGVIRAGRSMPVDHIEMTVCPMITVVPARVRLSDASGALRTVQEDLARMSEYEHVPLSRIQRWIQDWDGSLFDTLFSLSFKEKATSASWSVLDSQNPEPDYILAVEVVLDPGNDQAVVHAAYTSSDISPALVEKILGSLEETALRIAESSNWGVHLSSPTGRNPAPPAYPNNALDEDSVHIEDVDQELLSKLCTLAARFLRIDQSFFKPETSLLSLGLDSIKSVGLSRKLTQEGYALSSADIMRLSTPVRLAAFVQRASSSQQVEDPIGEAEFTAECQKLADAIDMSAIKLSFDDVVRVYPTSVLQAGMLSQTLSSGGRLYVHMFPLRLSNGIDLDRLRAAWTRAIEMFDILRTSFHFLTGHGVWVQAVHSVTPIQWLDGQYDAEANIVDTLNPFLDATDTDESAIFRKPPAFFHLLKGSTPDDAHRLVIVLHHALYDGLSIARLFDTVEALYRGSELAVAEQYHQLLPRLLWQEQNGTSFWVDRLRRLAHAPIPQRESIGGDAGVVHQCSLSVQVTEEHIRRACSDVQVTPQCVGQTAFAKLLASLTDRRDVVFGRVVSGRDVPGADEVIGPMLNTVPCRVTFQDGLRNRALLREVHGANIASMPWQHASLRAIQRELGVPTLWDSLFVYQPKQESLDAGVDAPWTFDAGDIDDINIHYRLNVELHESEDGFVVKAACMSDVANADELRDWMERYSAILVDLINRPDELWQTGLPEISASASRVEDESSLITAEDVPSDLEDQLGTLREILSSTTKVPSSKILVGTHLAAIGVDSITAVQIVAKARRSGLRLAAADVVQSRTVGDLVKKIKVVQPPSTDSSTTLAAPIDLPRTLWPMMISPVLVDAVERVTFASPGMEWMMGMWQRSKGSRFQHVFGYRLSSSIDPVKLEHAWSQLLRRHAVLRSTFVYDRESGVPRVVVFKPEALGSSWTCETLGGSKDELATVQQHMKDLVSHPPPVDRPITRAVLLRAPQGTYLLIHLHHFQYDAWSLQLIVDDLSRLYAGEQPMSSSDLDGFLRFTSSSIEIEQEQKKYWTAALPETSRIFPSQHKKPGTRGRDVYTKYAAISGVAKLERRARELAIPLQSVFLACWARVQAKRGGTDIPVFSLWHSGRTGDIQDVERLAVPCINVLPFGVRGARTVDTLVLARQVQDDLQGRSATVEQSRLAKVHEWVGRGDEPLSNVFVNIVKIAPELEKTSHALFEGLDVPYFIPDVPVNATAGVDDMHITNLIKDDIMIDIVVVQEKDQIVMSIEFSETVLDKAIAKQMLDEWAALVKNTLSEEKQDALCCVCM
ncbi:peptide synthetase [Daedaleopsis nitida]|nr:peptide synthetase [Daedaleopsis nitida]